MERIKGIDGLRALSALAVYFFHSGLLGMKGGILGVDVFFVISGFVITRMLANEYESTGRIQIFQFYVRRFLRLWPALFVCCFTIFYFHHEWFEWKEWPATLFYYANFTRLADSPYPGGFAHTWSLAIEEQFYIIWPLALLLLFKTRHKIPILIAFILAIWAWRFYLYEPFSPHNLLRVTNTPDVRFDGLFLGCIIALKPEHMKTAGNAWPVALIVLCVQLFVWKEDYHYIEAYRIPLSVLSAAILVSKVATDQDGMLTRILELKPLKGLGIISYAFYLWHYPILVFYGWFYGYWWSLLATIIFAWGSWILIERPVRDKRSAIAARLMSSSAATQQTPLARWQRKNQCPRRTDPADSRS